MAPPPLPDKTALLERAHRARIHWGNSPRPDQVKVAHDGEESVWYYPRPPVVRPSPDRLRVECGGQIIAETSRALLVCETAGAPVPYFPPGDVHTEWLTPTDHVTICEWKGAAVHYDLAVAGRHVRHAAYAYPDPLDDLDRGFGGIAGWFAFYPGRVDCFVGDERARRSRAAITAAGSPTGSGDRSRARPAAKAGRRGNTPTYLCDKAGLALRR